eukprot:NODE_523_length_6504_cov_0.524434.p4 type:complete len:126 gc:universal NODE_523_length_6504_cov_0.524434:734-1111(+)
MFVRIFNDVLPMLLHTGATYSFFSESVVNQLQVPIKKARLHQTILADIYTLDVKKLVHLPLQLDRETKVFMFRVVPNLKTLIILDRDMMKQHSINIDLNRKMIWVHHDLYHLAVLCRKHWYKQIP